MATSVQSSSKQAALDSLTSKLRQGHATGSALPPLGTRTVRLGASSPPAEQPAILPIASGSKQQQQSSSSAATPLPPLSLLPPPTPLPTEDISRIQFAAPKKRIISQQHLKKWESSSAMEDILGLIMYCNESIIGKKLSEPVYAENSDAVKAIIGILDRIAALVKETPAETDTTSRFGNPAFRTFYAKVVKESGDIHKIIPNLPRDSIVEVERYFIECFGNEKRIDYGSGMELNFVCWILCLVKLGVLDLQSEAPAVVLRIFWSYIKVMREIQSTYWLEPAGSHGVWGLDDYHFLPFLFGSSQLRDHKYLKPKAIHNQEILDEFSSDYMYFACIHFINSVSALLDLLIRKEADIPIQCRNYQIKTASLRWHSPMLDDISGVRTWAKVNEGMMKMYKAEVLLKLPIAQHIFFGSLVPFPHTEDDHELHELEDTVQEDEHGHIHAHGVGQDAGWGDCCGIPIPSAFAAAQEEKSKQSGVRRIPFD